MESYLSMLIDLHVLDVGVQWAIHNEINTTLVERTVVAGKARQMRLALLDHDLEMLHNLIGQLEEMGNGT